MWPSTFNKKSATISGWQALGDFAAVKQQLQKIRASTRISSKKDVVNRPLPPLPGGQSNKSVRFSLPLGPGGQMVSGSEGSGSDQGYESDQSRVSPHLARQPTLQPLTSCSYRRGDASWSCLDCSANWQTSDRNLPSRRMRGFTDTREHWPGSRGHSPDIIKTVITCTGGPSRTCRRATGTCPAQVPSC